MAPVAAEMGAQAAPDGLHRCQAYLYEVGLFDHVPLVAVKVTPTFTVPLTVGTAVLTGADPAATVGDTPATADTSKPAVNAADTTTATGRPHPRPGRPPRRARADHTCTRA